MSSLPFKEVKIDDIFQGRVTSRYPDISLKRDGTMMFYKDGDLISDRGIVRNDRYPHIVSALRKSDAIDMIGEVYIDGGSVLDINKRKNWREAKFMPFEVVGKSLMPLWAKKAILLDTVAEIGNDFITAPIQFDSVEEGWEYVMKHDEEGLVLRNEWGEYFKVKKLEEAKVRISHHEKGKGHGTFILENGSRLSGTSEGFVHRFHHLNRSGDVIAEIEFPFITESGKYFQPRLRQIYAET